MSITAAVPRDIFFPLTSEENFQYPDGQELSEVDLGNHRCVPFSSDSLYPSSDASRLLPLFPVTLGLPFSPETLASLESKGLEVRGFCGISRCKDGCNLQKLHSSSAV